MSTPDFTGSGRPGRPGSGWASDDRPRGHGYGYQPGPSGRGDVAGGYERAGSPRRESYAGTGRSGRGRPAGAAELGAAGGRDENQRPGDRYGFSGRGAAGESRSRAGGNGRAGEPGPGRRSGYDGDDDFGRERAGHARGRGSGSERGSGLARRGAPAAALLGRYTRRGGAGRRGGLDPDVDGYQGADGYGPGYADDYEPEGRGFPRFGRGGGGRGDRGGGGRGNGRGRGGRPPKRKGSWWRHWTWRKVVGVFLGTIGGFIVIAATIIGIAYSSTTIPTDVSAMALQQASTVYFSDGKTVVGTFGTTNRQVLTSNQIPAQLKDAVVAAEDRNFYNEGGISPTGILRAAYDNLFGGGSSLQGGSTITQQFVRNYYASIGTQQTLSRKIKEIFVAIKLAGAKSKDWILTQYLNTIYFGNGAYGVGAAAKTYFNEPASKLNVAQDAMIAAILNAPGFFNPTPGTQGYQPLVARWHYVLQGMVTLGKLTQQQAAAQKFPKVVSSNPAASGWTGYNGYIMQAVLSELENTYHYSLAQIDNDGLHIVTTISKPMMDALYATVNSSEKLMAAGGRALPWYAHVGAVLEQPGTGAIVAMYGGPSYSEPPKICKRIFCNVDMALQNRVQVGSSFKPYVLATARHQGMSVKTSVLDGTSPLCVPGDQYPRVYSVPATGPGASGCPSTPYGWHAFSNDAGDTGAGGPQSVVYATAQSLNTAYTDLAHRVGLQNIANMAKAFGVDTSSYSGGGSGLQDMVSQGQVGIALGTAALTVEEQANTFATLAANGQYVTPHVIKQIAQGTSLVPSKLTHREVLTPAEASDVNYPLSYDTINGTGTRAAMSDGRPIIGKTGTTETAQSAFFLGAIPQYSLAIGIFTNQQNASNSATAQTLNGLGGLPGYGGYWPAMIWHSFAEKEFAKLPVQQFATPDFGGTAWNLVGPGQGVQPRPKPSPTPTPTPTGSPTPTPTCTPLPGAHHCHHGPPPTSPPPSSGSPSPTGTCGPFGCPSRSPHAAPLTTSNSGGSTGGTTGTSGNAPMEVYPARAPRPRGSG